MSGSPRFRHSLVDDTIGSAPRVIVALHQS